jgi:putative flippase GtrA
MAARWLPERFTKFAVVGGGGVLLNSLVLYLLHQVLGMPVFLASAIAVEVAILNNYVWNDRWTFREQRPSRRRLAQFNVVSLGGLLITTGTVWLLATEHGVYFLVANLIGIGLATGWNFGVNVAWTWGHASHVELAHPLAQSRRASVVSTEV